MLSLTFLRLHLTREKLLIHPLNLPSVLTLTKTALCNPLLNPHPRFLPNLS
jgi:hypothetical protein